MIVRVNVVMGGPSAEHEISLRSGREVLRNLDTARYRPRAVVVTRDRRFYCGAPGKVPAMRDLASPARSRALQGPYVPWDAGRVWDNCDVAFIAMHGEYGEDGVFQGYLDSCGIPYQGSGVEASAVAMNKITTKILFERHKLVTPRGVVIVSSQAAAFTEETARRVGFPCFVKCPQSGSSRLMGRATDITGLRSLQEELAPHSRELLIESSVKGPEFSCGVLEYPDGTTRALPPVEIRPKGSAFFDFDAKYTDDGSEEIVPARRPAKLLRRIEEIALLAHQRIGCRGISRTDMILAHDRLFVLEINSLPGLTTNSLIPKAFKCQGGTYPELLDILLQTALAGKP